MGKRVSESRGRPSFSRTVLVLFAVAFFPTAIDFLRRDHPGWLIHLTILHFVLTALVFWGSNRFRFPIEGLCIILASSLVIRVGGL